MTFEFFKRLNKSFGVTNLILISNVTPKHSLLMVRAEWVFWRDLQRYGQPGAGQRASLVTRRVPKHRSIWVVVPSSPFFVFQTSFSTNRYLSLKKKKKVICLSKQKVASTLLIFLWCICISIAFCRIHLTTRMTSCRVPKLSTAVTCFVVVLCFKGALTWSWDEIVFKNFGTIQVNAFRSYIHVKL